MIRLWRSYQRTMDIRYLWPSIRKAAGPDRLKAEAAFRLHMEIDPAYKGMSEWDKLVFRKNLPELKGEGNG